MTITSNTGLNKTQRGLAYGGASLFFLAALTLSIVAATTKAGSSHYLAFAFVTAAIGTEVLKATLAPIVFGSSYLLRWRALAGVLLVLCLAVASLNALQFANTHMSERSVEATNELNNVALFNVTKLRLEAKATNSPELGERILAERQLAEHTSRGAPIVNASAASDPAAQWLHAVFGISSKAVELAIVGMFVLLLELGSALGFTLAHAGRPVVLEQNTPETHNLVLSYLKGRSGQTFVQRDAARDLGIPLKAFHDEMHRLSEGGQIKLTTDQRGTTVTAA